jgi:penicillin-binding protein 1A
VRDIGARFAADYLERFGFSESALPPNASLALGGGNVTTLELAAAYAVLANGGHAVGIRPDQQSLPEPYFVDKVYSASGEIIYDARESVELVCPEPDPAEAANTSGPPLIGQPGELYSLPLRCAERVESPQLVYLMTDVLKRVIKETSGRAANREFPEREDLAGKTGTTNDARDALFAGFNADIVAVARVGFDDNRPLGSHVGISEQGGVTAIPAWIDYMRVALDGQPEHQLPRPPGIADVRINPETGLAAADCNRSSVWEIFRATNVPAREPASSCTPVQRFTPSPGGEPGGDPGSGGETTRPSGRLFE